MPYMTADETLAALRRAESESQHDLHDDSPGPPSRTQRWTCRLCGASVLRHAGNLYGSALDGPCTFSRLELECPPRPANCGCVPICQCPPDDETEEGSA